MKKIVLVIILAGAGWYYFFGGRQLDEEKVRAFYDAQTRATLSRNPEALCDLMASDFRGTNRLQIVKRGAESDSNKEQACAEVKGMYAAIKGIGDRMGGMAQLDYNQDIDSISISADGKTASVATTFSLDIAGEMMKLRGTSTDTLVRRKGVVMSTRTEGNTRVVSRR